MASLQNARGNSAGFDRDSARAVTAAVILGTVGASTILVMPGLLGVIAEARQLTEQQLGFIASIDVFSMALSMGIVAFVLSCCGWRLLAALGLFVLALGNLASLLATDYNGIFWSRAVAGIGEGIAVAVSFAALGVTKSPDRSFGIYLVFALLFSAVTLYAFPYMANWGGDLPVFSYLIFLCGVNLLFLPWLTPHARSPDPHARARVPISPLVVGLGLLMVTLFFIAQGAVWSYLERIGLSQGISPPDIGIALALSALAGIAGAGIAMVVGNRWSRELPITAGVLIQILSMVLLTGEMSKASFVTAVMLFNFSWNLCQPYFSGIMSEVDPQGRVVVLMGSIQTVGVSVGPFIAALLIGPENFDPIGYLGILCVLLSLVTTFAVLSLWKHHRSGFASNG